jgi:translation initiation factor IF-2
MAARPAAARPAGAKPPVKRGVEGRKPILIPAPGRGVPPKPGLVRPVTARPGAARAGAPGSSTTATGTTTPGRTTGPIGQRTAMGTRIFPSRTGRSTPGRPGMPRLFPTGRRPGPAYGAGGRRKGKGKRQTTVRTSPVAPTPVAPPPDPSTFKDIEVSEGVTVKELAEKMDVKSKDLIRSLISKGILATINRPLDKEMATKLCNEFAFNPQFISFEEDIAREELGIEEDKAEDLVPRAPVVTMMGHVDHGKTSLLDAIRTTRVAEREHGGITQHIGAYHVDVKDRRVVFLDTPGHEAFTRMRARGAQVTDIVVLVVAADDGVMPQTIEAIHHARDAKVPLVVAMNKMDRAEANPDRVKQALSEHNVLVEDWGGSVVLVPVSAKKHTGLDNLLEMILLTSEMQEHKANPKRMAQGTVLEARLDRARGPVATVLISNGTLRTGDSFIVGSVYGKVRAMVDDRGNRISESGPSTAVEVLGLEGVPEAGDVLQALSDERRARQIGGYRQQIADKEKLAKSSRMSLDHLFEQIKEGEVKELRIILKTDVQGSCEVLTKTLNDLSTDKVKVKVIHTGTGAVNDSDVLLATASNAIILGFSVRPERSATLLAQKEGVDIRLYTVIYNVTKEITNAMVGLLEPTYKEAFLGRAEVRATFKVPKAGVIAGCQVIEGNILRSAEVRLLRDNVVIHEGKIGSLRRFKDDVGEVKQGFECGIGLERYNDLKDGDIVEAFRMERIQPTEL